MPICRSVKDKGASFGMKRGRMEGKREEGEGRQAGVSLERGGRKKFIEVRNCQENLEVRSNIVVGYLQCFSGWV